MFSLQNLVCVCVLANIFKQINNYIRKIIMKWHAYLSFYRHLIQLFECKLARKRKKERERERAFKKM